MSATIPIVTHESTEVRLVRIETKLDVMLQGVDDREHRIRALEKRFWVALGIAVASVAANVGAAVTWFGGSFGPGG